MQFCCRLSGTSSVSHQRLDCRRDCHPASLDWIRCSPGAVAVPHAESAPQHADPLVPSAMLHCQRVLAPVIANIHAVHSVQCTACSAQRVAHSVQSTAHSVQCTHGVQRSACNVSACCVTACSVCSVQSLRLCLRVQRSRLRLQRLLCSVCACSACASCTAHMACSAHSAASRLGAQRNYRRTGNHSRTCQILGLRENFVRFARTV